MARHYDSFVLRCWRLGGDEWRIELEHLQSGGRTRVATLAAAHDWISALCGEAGARGFSTGSRPGTTDKEVMPGELRSPDDQSIE